jgi:hypothetical protein
MTDPLKRRAGLILGGRGGPENELLEDGQEEVFSRTEVESGRIEHKAETDATDGVPTNVQPANPKPGGDNGREDSRGR